MTPFVWHFLSSGGFALRALTSSIPNFPVQLPYFSTLLPFCLKRTSSSTNQFFQTPVLPIDGSAPITFSEVEPVFHWCIFPFVQANFADYQSLDLLIRCFEGWLTVLGFCFRDFFSTKEEMRFSVLLFPTDHSTSEPQNPSNELLLKDLFFIWWLTHFSFWSSSTHRSVWRSPNLLSEYFLIFAVSTAEAVEPFLGLRNSVLFRTLLKIKFPLALDLAHSSTVLTKETFSSYRFLIEPTGTFASITTNPLDIAKCWLWSQYHGWVFLSLLIFEFITAFSNRSVDFSLVPPALWSLNCKKALCCWITLLLNSIKRISVDMSEGLASLRRVNDSTCQATKRGTTFLGWFFGFLWSSLTILLLVLSSPLQLTRFCCWALQSTSSCFPGQLEETSLWFHRTPNPW